MEPLIPERNYLIWRVKIADPINAIKRPITDKNKYMKFASYRIILIANKPSVSEYDNSELFQSKAADDGPLIGIAAVIIKPALKSWLIISKLTTPQI